VVDLLADLSLDYGNDRSVLVNPETMETKVPNLYACGDLTQLLPKQVSNATAHGKTAVYFISKKEA